MTKRDLESKLNQVKRHLNQAEHYSHVTLKQIEQSDEKRLAIERALFLVAQSSIDLVESYCRQKGLERPSSMHESMIVLRESGIISSALCKNMLKMVGFRNVLTHGYSKIDYEKVIDVMRFGLKDVKQLLRALRK